jgi:universal stress protein A
MRRENQRRRGLFRLAQPAASAQKPHPRGGTPSHPARRTVLHPTDYSDHSRQAFELACRVARDRGSRLVVLHVAEPVHVSSPGMASLPPLPKGYRGAWESRLRLMQPRDPNVRVEHRLEEGDVAAAILRVARQEQSDLIVMGTRGRTGLRRLLGRSVTAKVRRKSPCPVVTVNVPPDRRTAVRGHTSLSGPRPTSDTDSDGGSHDVSSKHPAPDGLLALRR